MAWYDLIGSLGVCCFLTAYFLLQKGSWASGSLRYLLTNLAGAILVAVSLLADWNFAAFMLEVAWALISIYGIVKTLKNRKPE